MTKVTVLTRAGDRLSIDAKPESSLMQVIRDAGIDEVLALCGGTCSCATCHVYVSAEPAVDLPPLSSDEDDLLESSMYRTPRSRLSCQIPVTAEMIAIDITIAPSD